MRLQYDYGGRGAHPLPLGFSKSSFGSLRGSRRKAAPRSPSQASILLFFQKGQGRILGPRTAEFAPRAVVAGSPRGNGCRQRSSAFTRRDTVWSGVNPPGATMSRRSPSPTCIGSSETVYLPSRSTRAGFLLLFTTPREILGAFALLGNFC